MRFELMKLLWDDEKRRPAQERIFKEVLLKLYRTTDYTPAMRDLCYRARNTLRAHKVGYTLRVAGGKIWLAKCGDCDAFEH